FTPSRPRRNDTPLPYTTLFRSDRRAAPTARMADSSTLPRRGLMLILSSPSGAGKTTIARRLLAAEDNLQMSVSVTTRPMRPGEVDGRDYEFTDLERFGEMVEADDFLEWAEVFDNRYGTPR